MKKCKKGHTAGRNKRGECVTCKRSRQREWVRAKRGSTKRGEPAVTAEPQEQPTEPTQREQPMAVEAMFKVIPLGVARRDAGFRKRQREEASTLNAPLPQAAVTVTVEGAPAHGLTVAVIPDCQVRTGVPTEHLRAAGLYIADKRPDVIVQIGDFADMPSLSTHDEDSSATGRVQSYRADVDAVRRAMDVLMDPIHKAQGYDPVKILTLGNHEDRITRAIEANPRQLEGVYSLKDLGYEQHGWNTFDFLRPVILNGVAFCHYFPSGVMGKPFASAATMLKNGSMSAI